ncbi:hypothetical protein ACFVWR_02200 [Leifsonia sp. NPDC058292]|uniref:hypothetical protein n=1 Tax=Leifsonia sp. NPDC058292 TaxID=3346428 RepID=UPI0036D8B6DA
MGEHVEGEGSVPNGASYAVDVVSILCPLGAAAIVVFFRRPIVNRLRSVVPQKNLKKVNAAVFVGAFAVATFVAGWILAVLVPGSPAVLWLSVFAAALLAWIVAWALLANES